MGGMAATGGRDAQIVVLSYHPPFDVLGITAYQQTSMELMPGMPVGSVLPFEIVSHLDANCAFASVTTLYGNGAAVWTTERSTRLRTEATGTGD
jgi:acyl-CoA reductase-like NAD-dependent aldehyde dehydrogenase